MPSFVYKMLLITVIIWVILIAMIAYNLSNLSTMAENWRCGDRDTEIFSIQKDDYAIVSIFCGKGYDKDYQVTTDVIRRSTFKAVEDYFASRFESHRSYDYYLPPNANGFRAKIYAVDKRKECW